MAMNTDASTLKHRVDDALARCRKAKLEEEKKKAVAEALAQAAADGEGGLMRRFFS